MRGVILDNLVGTLRDTDANLIKYQEMHKGYEALKELPDEKKAKESEKLANDMANKIKDVMGIDEDITVVVSFTDEAKTDEMASFVRQDGKETGVIQIFINVKDVDVSDMEQVYNALGAELNHYNPSNPYVYDKKEKEVDKNSNLHDLEDKFTMIGRTSLTGEDNSFYENILNGSSVLNNGNSLYGNYTEDDLDLAVNGAVKGICSGVGIMGLCKKGKDFAVKGVDAVGLGTPARVIYNADKKIFDKEAEKIGNSIGETLKENGKKILDAGKNGNSNKSSSGNGEKNCDEECYKNNLNKNYYYNPLNAIMEEKDNDMSNYFNPNYFLTGKVVLH